MKIGIYNIFTSFWFMTMFVCGGILTYISIDKNLFTSDLLFLAKFFVGLPILISIGLFMYALYKFRILIIDRNTITSIYPFLFKKERIDLAKVQNLKLETFFAFQGTIFRNVMITDSDKTIEISDLEFENFEKLISELNIVSSKKREIDLEQATSNISNINFNVYTLSGLLIFLVFNAIWNSRFHWIVLIFLISIVFLLYGSIKRKVAYNRIIKK